MNQKWFVPFFMMRDALKGIHETHDGKNVAINVVTNTSFSLRTLKFLFERNSV